MSTRTYLAGLSALAFATVALTSAEAASAVTYDLARADVLRTVIVNPDEPVTALLADWTKANAASESATAGASLTPATSASGYRLKLFRAGRGVTRVKADYSLGDRLTPPADLGEIDWVETYNRSVAVNPANTFLLTGTGDMSDAAIYLARGADPLTVVWVKADGSESQRTYTVSDTAASRPYRLYRTDDPYNNSPVSLGDKFVKVIGADSLFTLDYGVKVIKNEDGSATTNEHAVTRGVYLSSGNNLYCVGDVKGQFLLAYYDSADFTRVLQVQVIEACTPSVKIASAVVGQELKPMADGYPTEGLYPQVVDSGRTTRDGRGDFIYVHVGSASYAPHRNAAFAVRPTMDEDDVSDHTWDATINWYAPDELGVSWPFEQTQYSIRWGEGVKLLIADEGAEAGQMPIFPDDWSVSLCGYQSPDGHVRSVGDWRSEGRSLLAVSGYNAKGLADIAFVQIDATFASKASAPTNTCCVGKRVLPTDPSAVCVTNDAGRTWLGYIYESASATCFDAEDYNAPSEDVVNGETVTTEISATDLEEAKQIQASQSIRSDIFFVNVPESNNPKQLLDVWWNTAVVAGDLAGTAYFPTVRELYKPAFPDPNETEQIVLASMKGSSGVSVWEQEVKGESVTVWHTNEIIMADTLPQVYAGSGDAVDGTGKGWNPNAAHAFCMAGDGGYVCWALRCDMTTHSTLKNPLVYVKGTVTDEEGVEERRVWTYYVMPTNAVYTSFEGRMLVGNQLPGPHPLDLLVDPWLPEIWWETPTDHHKIVAHRDRKGVVWARRDGDLPIHMYYANRDEYAYVKRQNGIPRNWNATVPSNTPVPWNCTLKAEQVVSTVEPNVWTWHAYWGSGYPTMKVARTLTKASDMLDEVWNASSAAVLWPEPDNMADGVVKRDNSVIQLTDPTCNQTASLDFGIVRGDLMTKLGFSCDPAGNCTERDGRWYFRDAPTALSDRLYYDPNADISKCLVLKGALVERTGGTDILYVNVLSKAERDAVKALVDESNEYKAKWDSAVGSLAKESVKPTSYEYRTKISQNEREYVEFGVNYEPRDQYALTSLGGGGVAGATNWVVWIENDADPDSGLGVKEGDPISMHVMQIVPEYNLGDCVTRTDPNNLLSQMLDVIYTEPLGGNPDDFYFQWQQAEPQANGSKPGENDWRDAGRSGSGAVRFTLGTQGTMADLKNTYYRVRYRANGGTKAAKTMGTGWSDWSAPCLAEGWIQRVINSITPFTQRVTDLYENPPETTVSMLQQIGGPYQGDIALNMDNMTQVGLLETYMTLMNTAESMSISMGDDASIDDTGVNKQLLQLVERMDDFYTLLGNEAYSDAANPTIAMGTGDDFEQVSSGLFAFDNQVPTLLDEELALLRGRGVIEDERTGNDVTAYQEAPIYNRLLWNYTRGLNEGEVAYAMNYNTTANVGETEIDAETAAAEYPQGHGDAWGHYLSGLKLWYRLLRNPSFSWSVSMGEMNVDDHAINVDYFEEEKICAAAASLGKTAEHVVDLTARKTWRDRAGAVSAADAGYEDKVASRAFGYGEWGNKGGVATFVNWMVGNSLLPAAETNETDYTDQGLLKINRSTVSELADLATSYERIQRKVDSLNANLNPLGLAENAVPFGLSTSVADGGDTHFEQTLATAKTALKNAHALLERAGQESARLRQIAADEQAEADAAAEEEESFKQKLIAYYGYPYAGDIGVGKTYAQDYDGPDLYHWMYVDNSLTLGDPVTTLTVNVSRNAYDWDVTDGTSSGGQDITLRYDYSRAGFVIKPYTLTGSRRAFGKLQNAYVAYLNAVSALDKAYTTYNSTKATTDRYIVDMTKLISKFLAATVTGIGLNSATKKETALQTKLDQTYMTDAIQDLSEINIQLTFTALTSSDLTINGKVGKDKLDGGLELKNATSWDLGLLEKKFELEQKEQMAALKKLCAELSAATKKKTNWNTANGLVTAVYGIWDLVVGLTDRTQQYYNTLNQLGLAVVNAYNAVGPAAENVLTLKAEAEAILNERQAAREKRARKAASSRYSDMAHRLVRDESLDTYADAFDLAQKYTWLAAKAYDYETGGEITAGSGTSDFLDAIVGTRLPGELQADGSPMRWSGAGDAGLSDVLARLEENWTVQKARLGINNPQGEMTWFSLRTEAFRILPGADGLNVWRNKLDTYRVPSLRCVPAYERFCLKATDTTLDEPAIVIPLGTTIEVGKNFFGLDLAGGDHRFSETYFATKIAEAGVELVGYNVGKDGAKISTFAETPYVYLVPTGCDRMRAPTTGDVLSYNVADQLLPVPNLLGASTLAGEWDALYDALSSGSAAVNTRAYPAFRANGDANASTLIGRSVWNTEWVLVIPASSLRSDGDKALTEFVWGNDETAGITDIKIGFRTYSHWGK